MIVDLIITKEILQFNKIYLSTLTTMIQIMKEIMKTYFNNKKLIKKTYLNNNMKMNIIKKIINYMKTVHVKITLKNLQLPHKMHHKLEHRQMLEHRQIPDLSEFELEVPVQDKIHLALKLT